MLNKSREYHLVVGNLHGVKWEQGGKLYNNDGLQVTFDGELLEKPPEENPRKTKGNPSLGVKETPQNAPEESSPGLSFDQIKKDQTGETDADLLMIERIKIAAPNDPNFVKKAEIIAELEAAGIEYNPRSSRDDLSLILKEHLGIG